MEAILPAVALFGVFIFIFAILMPLFRRDRLQGKHVFITGGSKGLGLEMAKEFVRRGCDVSILARNQSDLLSALEELKALKKSLGVTSKLQSLSADTGNSDELAKAISTAEDTAGPIEILICNAGFSIPGNFLDQPMGNFERQMDVNYMGTVRTVKCALPRMLARHRGHIVFVTSMLSVLGFAGYSSYAPSKWAVRGFADCLHNEVSLIPVPMHLNSIFDIPQNSKQTHFPPFFAASRHRCGC